MAKIAELLESAKSLHRAGRCQEALPLYQRVIEADPARVDVHYLLGAAWYGLGNLDEAVACYHHALELKPGEAGAHYNLGTLLMQQRKLDEAASHFRRTLELKPDYAEAHNNLAAVLISQKQFAQAAACSRQALQRRANYVEAHVNMGIALAGLNRPNEAVACFRTAIALAPNYLDGWYNLGKALVAGEQLDEAVAAYTRALQLNPEHAQSWLGRAGARRKQNRLREAETDLRQLLASRPQSVEAHCDLGCVLQDQLRLDEAMSCYQRALALNGDVAEVHQNIAIVLAAQHHLDKALGSFRRCFEVKPDWAEAHVNHAMTLLLAGRFAEGWAEHEWRLKRPARAQTPVLQPRWAGESLAGRTILLRSEQGHGDTLQFIRYVQLLKRQGGRVIVECPSSLTRLLASSPGVDGVATEGESLPPCDVYLPMQSLPLVLGTTLENIPADIPYLSPDDESLERWKQEFSADAGFKIGIAWQGNPAYSSDRTRSFPLSEFAPIAGLSGVRLYSLQLGSGREQLAEVAGRWPVTDLGDRLGDFHNTAAIMRNLDLVITCDSAPVHLAGALGVPVWLALSYAPHWVWMLDREDSPWYPSVRLFRQSRLGDWPGVFQRMRQALAEILE